MPAFRTGVVTAVLEARAGLQRVAVDLPSGPSRAYVLTDVIGEVAVGDRVVVNTTAVDLDLGTGGWHVVHWNLERDEHVVAGPGHIMKARYTSVQSDVGAAEELHTDRLADITSIDGMPVVVAGLHSHLAAVAAAVHLTRPDARLVYVMSDSAALPIAISDLVVDLQRVGWVHDTITAGNAFGGRHEAVNIFSALAVARTVAGASIVVVAPGPGVVGTNTALGTSSVDTGSQLDAVSALGGRAIAVVRASDADPRPRHRGVSHHTLTALGTATSRAATVAVPEGPHSDRLRAELAGAVEGRHGIEAVVAADVFGAFAAAELTVRSMGRAALDDRLLFECAAAAGTLAAQWLP